MGTKSTNCEQAKREHEEGPELDSPPLSASLADNPALVHKGDICDGVASGVSATIRNEIFVETGGAHGAYVEKHGVGSQSFGVGSEAYLLQVLAVTGDMGPPGSFETNVGVIYAGETEASVPEHHLIAVSEAGDGSKVSKDLDPETGPVHPALAVASVYGEAALNGHVGVRSVLELDNDIGKTVVHGDDGCLYAKLDFPLLCHQTAENLELAKKNQLEELDSRAFAVLQHPIVALAVDVGNKLYAPGNVSTSPVDDCDNIDSSPSLDDRVHTTTSISKPDPNADEFSTSDDNLRYLQQEGFEFIYPADCYIDSPFDNCILRGPDKIFTLEINGYKINHGYVVGDCPFSNDQGSSSRPVDPLIDLKISNLEFATTREDDAFHSGNENQHINTIQPEVVLSFNNHNRIAQRYVDSLKIAQQRFRMKLDDSELEDETVYRDSRLTTLLRLAAFETKPTGGVGRTIFREQTGSFGELGEDIPIDAPGHVSRLVERDTDDYMMSLSKFMRHKRTRCNKSYPMVEENSRNVGTTTIKEPAQSLGNSRQLMPIVFNPQSTLHRPRPQNDPENLSRNSQTPASPASPPPPSSPSLAELFPQFAPFSLVEPFQSDEAKEQLRRARELSDLSEDGTTWNTVGDRIVMAVSVSAPGSILEFGFEDEGDEEEYSDSENSNESFDEDTGIFSGSPPSRGSQKYKSLLDPEDPNDPSKEGESDPFNLDDPATALNTQLNARLMGHRADPPLGIGTQRSKRRPSSLKWPDQDDIDSQLKSEEKSPRLHLRPRHCKPRPLNRPTLPGRSSSESSIPMMPRSWERHGSAKPDIKARMKVIGDAAAPSGGLRIKLLESPPAHAIPPRPDPSIPLFGAAVRIDSDTHSAVPLWNNPPPKSTLKKSLATRRDAFSTHYPASNTSQARVKFRDVNQDNILIFKSDEAIDESSESELDCTGDSAYDFLPAMTNSSPPMSSPMSSPPIPLPNPARLLSSLSVANPLSPLPEARDEDSATSTAEGLSSSPASPQQLVRSMLDVDNVPASPGPSSRRTSRSEATADTAATAPARLGGTISAVGSLASTTAAASLKSTSPKQSRFRRAVKKLAFLKKGGKDEGTDAGVGAGMNQDAVLTAA